MSSWSASPRGRSAGAAYPGVRHGDGLDVGEQQGQEHRDDGGAAEHFDGGVVADPQGHDHELGRRPEDAAHHGEGRLTGLVLGDLLRRLLVLGVLRGAGGEGVSVRPRGGESVSCLIEWAIQSAPGL